jgi:hypothetical protein
MANAGPWPLGHSCAWSVDRRLQLRVLKDFRANQGLLSRVPSALRAAVTYSAADPDAHRAFRFVDDATVDATEYLQFIVTERGGDRRHRAFLNHREAVGGALLITMIFFSALAFTVLENAMSVIFFHRVAVRRRRFIVSALMPYCFIFFLAIGLLVITVVAGKLAVLATHNVMVFGVPKSLDDLSGYLLYLLGVGGKS